MWTVAYMMMNIILYYCMNCGIYNEYLDCFHTEHAKKIFYFYYLPLLILKVMVNKDIHRFWRYLYQEVLKITAWLNDWLLVRAIARREIKLATNPRLWSTHVGQVTFFSNQLRTITFVYIILVFLMRILLLLFF